MQFDSLEATRFQRAIWHPFILSAVAWVWKATDTDSLDFPRVHRASVIRRYYAHRIEHPFAVARLWVRDSGC